MTRKDSELCSKVRDRVNNWDNYWNINRVQYYEWIEFVLGSQWKEDESKLFERYAKIPLFNNKLGVITNHILGDQIRNTPNLQIVPGENVSVEEAEVRSSLIKDISLNSDSKTVYQTAYSQALIGGFGAYRIGTEYLDDFSFDQQIKLYSFKDPNQCYWDLAAQELCKTDGMYSGFKTRFSRKAFRDKWGKDIERQIGSSSISENTMSAFANDDSITQIDDFEKEPDPEFNMIYKLSDGSVVTNKEFSEIEKVKVDGKRVLRKEGNLLTVLEKRKVLRYRTKHRQIAGDFVLEETDFPASHLPIIFVDQRSYYTKEGQQVTRSFFQDVRDAQKYLNYIATQSAHILKISRYDQFMAPRKSISANDTQQIWRDPSVIQGALVYDETPSGGRPEQIRPPELSQSLRTEYERTLMDIQSGTGIFNTQLGDNSNEISGEAVRRRANRGDKNTQVSRTSLEIAIATGGEIVNEMIPKIYDTHRTLTLPMPNSTEEKVEINKPMDEYGLQIQNDMTRGEFKIRLKPGLSYEGQKEEALESLQSVLMADKSGSVFPMIADLYAENLPLDNNMEIRNRLRTMVPQEIIEAGKTGKPLPPKQPQPSPEMLMMQLKQKELELKAQQAQQQAQMKMHELELKRAELQRKTLETHNDMTLEWEKLEAEKEEAAAQLQEALLRYQAESNRIQADLEINNSHNLIKILTHTTTKPRTEHDSTK